MALAPTTLDYRGGYPKFLATKDPSRENFMHAAHSALGTTQNNLRYLLVNTTLYSCNFEAF